MAKGGANETGRFDDLVDDEEGVGLVAARASEEDELKADGPVLRRKSMFADEDSNIKRVELRIGGMTVRGSSLFWRSDVTLPLTRLIDSAEPVSLLSNRFSRHNQESSQSRFLFLQNVELWNTMKRLKIQDGPLKRLQKKLRIVGLKLK